MFLLCLFAFSGLVTPSRAGAIGGPIQVIDSLIGKLEPIIGAGLAPVMAFLCWKESRKSSGQPNVTVAKIAPQPAGTDYSLVPFIPYAIALSYWCYCNIKTK